MKPKRGSIEEEGERERIGAPGQTELLLLLSAAAWGIGIALSLVGRFIRPAPSDQLVGHLSLQNIDASALFFFLPVLIGLPIIAAFVGRSLVIHHFGPPATTGSAAIAAISLGWGLWLSGMRSPTASVLLVPLIGTTIAFTTRRRAARWSGEDLILIPVSISVFLSLLDLFPTAGVALVLSVGLLLVLLMRVGFASILSSEQVVARAFVLAPLGIVMQSSFVDYPVRSAGWPPFLFTLLAPLLTAMLLRAKPRFSTLARRITIWFVFPLVIFTFPSTRGIGYAEDLPRVHMFEDGHSLMPASEMLRGELPWRDVVPGHGLLSDGLIDLIAMKVADERIGRVLLWRWRFASLNSVAIYFLAFAATKSAEAGLGVFFLGYGLWGGPFLRAVFSIFAVATAVTATVRERPRLFALSGFLLVLSGLLSLDFCVYAGAAISGALLTYGRGWRTSAVATGMAASGIALASIPVLVVLAWLGILDDFFRTTFIEILPLGAVYGLGFPDLAAVVPPPWTFPEVIVSLLGRSSFPYLAWFFVLIVVSVLAVVPKRTRSWSALIVMGIWILVAAISWMERHHLYYMFVVPAFFVTLIMIGWRRGGGSSRAATAALVALIVLAQPSSQLVVMASNRLMIPGPSEGWSEYKGVPRAAGALFPEADVENLELMETLINGNLSEGETWFDFADAPILYYLFDRPSPVRQYEVAFYQSEALQREVIRRLETNPKVRFAILRFPTGGIHSIDGIPNEVRAPLVAQYLRDNFEVVFDTGEIRIAERRRYPENSQEKSARSE